MISASKCTLSLNNLKILRPKVTKNLTNLQNKFCESDGKYEIDWRLEEYDIKFSTALQWSR